MIDALIAGKLREVPWQSAGKDGKPYTIAKIDISNTDEMLVCGAIAFDEKLQDALLAMDEGDSVVLSGSLHPKVYRAEDERYHVALDLVCHGVMTAYHAQHKRQAIGGQDGD